MDNDADTFVARTILVNEVGNHFLAKLRFLFFGARNHQWMYDGHSLSRKLADAGFSQVTIFPMGVTMLKDPGVLDLYQGLSESVYVEAVKP